jgi:lysosomal Pro-X carboxypeptidase
VNKKSFKDGSPLFFYTGNEGTIEDFAANTGIMYDIAPMFNALIVFCEHRYYGNGSSLPYGEDSLSVSSVFNS